MRRLLTVAVAAACAVALAAYAWFGTFTRYAYDDFCYGDALHKLGFWRFQPYWYTRWSGRFVFTLAMACVESFGPRITPLLPVLLIIVWSAVAMRSFRTPAALAIVYATFAGAANVWQSAMWQTGLLTYAMPLVMMTAWCGVWLRRADDRVHPIDVILPLLAGGCSETAAICNVIFFVLGALFAGPRRRPFVAASLAALTSFAIVAAAPGNLLRHADAHVHGLAVQPALHWTSWALRFELVTAWPQLFFVFAVAAIFAPRRAGVRGACFAPVLVLACAVAVQLASFAGVGTPLPPRALMITHFYFLVAAAIWGSALAPRRIFAIAVVAALAAPVLMTMRIFRALPAERRLAAMLDDSFAKVQEGAAVVAGPKYVHGVEMYFPDPAHDSNRCIARYFGVPEVRGSD